MGQHAKGVLFLAVVAVIVPACGSGGGSSSGGSSGGGGGAPSYFTATTDTQLPTAAGYLDFNALGDIIPLANSRVLLDDQGLTQVHIVNIISGAIEKSFQLSAAPGDMEYDVDTVTLYTTLLGASFLARVDLATDAVSTIAISAPAVDLALGNNGQIFVSVASSYFGPVDIVDGLNATLIKTVAGQFYNLMVFDRAQNQLITGSRGLSPSTLTRYAFDPIALTLTQTQNFWNIGSNGQDLSVSTDGRRLVYACGAGNGGPYDIWEISSDDINVSYGAFLTGPYPRSAAFNLGGTKVVTSNGYDFQVYVVSTHTLNQSTPFLKAGCPYDFFHTVRFSRGGGIVYALADCEFDNSRSRLQWELVVP